MKTMKTIDIIGNNYYGSWNRIRRACRSIIIQNGKILLTHMKKHDVWMLPGGGTEENETERQCVIRETAEETGYLIMPSDCLLEIDEYYENWKYVTYYFSGEIIAVSGSRLTEVEKRAGMESAWISVSECMEIFSKHNDYAQTDEVKRGIYERECMALKEILGSGYENRE